MDTHARITSPITEPVDRSYQQRAEPLPIKGLIVMYVTVLAIIHFFPASLAHTNSLQPDTHQAEEKTEHRVHAALIPTRLQNDYQDVFGLDLNLTYNNARRNALTSETHSSRAPVTELQLAKTNCLSDNVNAQARLATADPCLF